jgi:hypothetical protein
MIIRTYRCNDCLEVFEVSLESGSDGDPDCPYCAKELVWQPHAFSIRTNKSRAVDYTQKVLEEDYGLTDWKDNNKEGDVAFKAPVETTADREAKEKMSREIQELAESMKVEGHPAMDNPGMQNAIKGFFGGGMGGAPNPMQSAALMASAKVGPAAGFDPIGGPLGLRRAKEKGVLPTGFRVIGRDTFDNPARKA